MSSGCVVGTHQHHDLRALALLQRGELAFQLLRLLRIQRAGEIGDARVQRGNGDVGACGRDDAERRKQRDHAAPFAERDSAPLRLHGGAAA